MFRLYAGLIIPLSISLVYVTVPAETTSEHYQRFVNLARSGSFISSEQTKAFFNDVVREFLREMQSISEDVPVANKNTCRKEIELLRVRCQKALEHLQPEDTVALKTLLSKLPATIKSLLALKSDEHALLMTIIDDAFKKYAEENDINFVRPDVICTMMAPEVAEKFADDISILYRAACQELLPHVLRAAVYTLQLVSYDDFLEFEQRSKEPFITTCYNYLQLSHNSAAQELARSIILEADTIGLLLTRNSEYKSSTLKALALLRQHAAIAAQYYQRFI